MSETIPFSVGQRVSLSLQTGDLPEGLIGTVTSLEPPDRVWVEFKDVYDDTDRPDVKLKVYATDIQPAAEDIEKR